jgi:hypothetical protein
MKKFRVILIASKCRKGFYLTWNDVEHFNTCLGICFYKLKNFLYYKLRGYSVYFLVIRTSDLISDKDF